MTRPYRAIDLSDLNTYSIAGRRHKAWVDTVGRLPREGASASHLLASFPDYLGATEFRNVVTAIVQAVRHDRPVVAAFGAHVIKVGCGPILVDLIRRGIVHAIAGNGACAIHDVEIATRGETSEEVADTIRDGSFGMVTETLAFFDDVARRSFRESTGLGATVGKLLVERQAPHRNASVFATAYEASIPATLHVALGTDTVHVSPGADGGALGTASLRDFRLICDVVSDLGTSEECAVGGVWLNIGSAVVLPEVFLKAVSVARNLGANLEGMTTANFDMMRHYRPHQNVITRPVSDGRGHEIIGHHEIMLPLLRQALIEELATARSR